MIDVVRLPDPDAAWRDQLRRGVRTVDALEAAIHLTESEREGALRAIAGGFPMAITPYYLSLADRDDPRCPIRLQCVPRREEGEASPGDMEDPLGEEDPRHAVAPDLVCRYPDRALLLVTDRCSVYCRFCTRSRMVGSDGGARSLDGLEPAMKWLEANPQVEEVIVSGGDPLTLSDERIGAVLSRLRRIRSIGVVRVATRTPVTLPMRITDALCRTLARFHPIWVMTHFNHPAECTDEAMAACERLADHGMPVMNQAVLLSGVNSCACVLEKLFRRLVRSRVKPYYLLQCDPVSGTGHLRTRTDVGLRIVEALQGRLSGIAMPRLILDAPGGEGKVPLSPDFVVSRSPDELVVRTWRGVDVAYPERRTEELRPRTCACGS